MPSNKMVLLFFFQSSPDFCVELLVSNTRIREGIKKTVFFLQKNSERGEGGGGIKNWGFWIFLPKGGVSSNP